MQAKETLFSKDAAKSLVGVPAAELPATVVSLVKVAPKASQPDVVDALVRADKDFDFVLIPGAGHGAAESDLGRRRRAEFFVRHLGSPLPAATPPPSNP